MGGQAGPNMADIFVSYTNSDREWAFWIAKELEGLGHTPHIHEWEIGGGDDIYAWMERRHDAADHVLCVISDDYLKAPYSTLERNAALWQAVSKKSGFVLLVVVKACKLPTLSDHIRRCELFGVPEDAARTRFRNFIIKREAPKVVAFPGKWSAVSNIPIQVPVNFMGRDEPLSAIKTALARYEGRVAIMALHGLRGVGKTTLAATYAMRSQNDYRATWWIRAQTASTMRADLVALGVRLTWIAPDEKEEPALAAVMERLQHEGEGILLIYDNAVDAVSLKPYLPRGAAHVLVTSNARAWRGIAEPVEIALWPTDIGADYLVARTGRPHERIGALALSEALGGLPLAHEQAAAYCERLEVSFEEYQRRFEASPARFLDDARYAPVEHNDGMTVAKSFALAIDEASKLHPGAEPLIIYAALLAPEPIPLYLFSEAKERFQEPFASAIADDGLDEAVAALRTFALIDRETIADERDSTVTTDCIRLHRLVRQLAATRLDNEKRATIYGTLVEAVAAVYPDNVSDDPNTWRRARRLDALALALVDGVVLPQGSQERVADLLVGLGSYRNSSLAAFAEARTQFERALSIYENVLGSDHPDTADCLNNIAFLLQIQGDLAGARPLYERALAIYERKLGPEDPSTAAGLNNVAFLLRAQGDLAGARPYYERALAINEKVHGPEHPETALSLNNLAFLLQAQGDLVRAQPLFVRSLAIREKVLGPEHPSTATSLNNFAVVLRAQGDLSGAQSHFERALAINEKVLGSEHPSTSRVRHNLARLLLACDNADRALTLAKAALAAHEKILGPSHRWTIESARVTANAFNALGMDEQAKALRNLNTGSNKSSLRPARGLRTEIHESGCHKRTTDPLGSHGRR